MLSKTIEHLEKFNKEINFKAYIDEIYKCQKEYGKMNLDTFYKSMLRASLEGVATAKGLKQRVDFDKEYEITFKNNEHAKEELFKNHSVMAMIENWLKYKQIYKFDLDTLEMLINSELKDMTQEELKALKMPYNTFIIENEIGLDTYVFDSIIVSKRYREEYGEVCLSIYAFQKDDNLVNTRMIKFELFLNENKTLFEFLQDKPELDVAFVKKVLNLVLYLCQPKLDVIYKKSEKKPMKKGMPKHFYSVDYDENEVGCRLGGAIRNYKVIYESTGGKHTGGTKRPHTRSGHFHHYWCGKGRTDLVVRYVEPTFVLGGSKEAIMHKVK